MGQAKKRGSLEERRAKAIEVQAKEAKEAAVKPEERTSLGRNSSVALALMAAVMSLPEERPRTEMTLANIHHPDFPEMRPHKKKFERRRP